jgi:hypothetical protein
VEGSSKIWHLY